MRGEECQSGHHRLLEGIEVEGSTRIDQERPRTLSPAVPVESWFLFDTNIDVTLSLVSVVLSHYVTETNFTTQI